MARMDSCVRAHGYMSPTDLYAHKHGWVVNYICFRLKKYVKLQGKLGLRGFVCEWLSRCGLLLVTMVTDAPDILHGENIVTWVTETGLQRLSYGDWV